MWFKIKKNECFEFVVFFCSFRFDLEKVKVISWDKKIKSINSCCIFEISDLIKNWYLFFGILFVVLVGGGGGGGVS